MGEIRESEKIKWKKEKVLFSERERDTHKEEKAKGINGGRRENNHFRRKEWRDFNLKKRKMKK